MPNNFKVSKTSAGPYLRFNGILIKSWLGTEHNEEADQLCYDLNNSIEDE